MKTKYPPHLDLLSPEWKISKRFDLKRKFTIYEKMDQSIILIFVQSFASIKELANCKADLQNSAVAMIWLIKEGYGSWKKQSFLENRDNSRSYFYSYDRQNKKIQAFDIRQVHMVSGGIYITHPFSINLKKPYFRQTEFAGVEGDFAHRKNTSETFAKAIENRIQKPKQNRNLKSFFNAKTAKTLLQKSYLVILKKLES